MHGIGLACLEAVSQDTAAAKGDAQTPAKKWKGKAPWNFQGSSKTTFRNPRWFSSKIVSLNIFLKKNQEGVSDAMEMGDDGGYCLCTPPRKLTWNLKMNGFQ